MRNITKIKNRKIQCVFLIALVILSYVPLVWAQEDPCQKDPNSAECQQKKIEETIKTGDVKTLTPEIIAKNLDLVISNNRLKDLNNNQLKIVIPEIVSKRPEAILQLTASQVKDFASDIAKNPTAVKKLTLAQVQDPITRKDLAFLSNFKNLKDFDPAVASVIFRDGFAVYEKIAGQLTQFLGTLGSANVDVTGRLFLTFPVQVCQGQNPNSCTTTPIIQLGPRYSFELDPRTNIPKFIMQSGGLGCTGGSGEGAGITGLAVGTAVAAEQCPLASATVFPGSISNIYQKDGFYIVTLANGMLIYIQEGGVRAENGNTLTLNENAKIIFDFGGFGHTLVSQYSGTKLLFDTAKNEMRFSGPAKLSGEIYLNKFELTNYKGYTNSDIGVTYGDEVVMSFGPSGLFLSTELADVEFGKFKSAGGVNAYFSTSGEFTKGTVTSFRSHIQTPNWKVTANGDLAVNVFTDGKEHTGNYVSFGNKKVTAEGDEFDVEILKNKGNPYLDVNPNGRFIISPLGGKVVLDNSKPGKLASLTATGPADKEYWAQIMNSNYIAYAGKKGMEWNRDLILRMGELIFTKETGPTVTPIIYKVLDEKGKSVMSKDVSELNVLIDGDGVSFVGADAEGNLGCPIAGTSPVGAAVTGAAVGEKCKVIRYDSYVSFDKQNKKLIDDLDKKGVTITSTDPVLRLLPSSLAEIRKTVYDVDKKSEPLSRYLREISITDKVQPPAMAGRISLNKEEFNNLPVGEKERHIIVATVESYLRANPNSRDELISTFIKKNPGAYEHLNEEETNKKIAEHAGYSIYTYIQIGTPADAGFRVSADRTKRGLPLDIDYPGTVSVLKNKGLLK